MAERFGWIDYTVVAVVLLISTSIGMYHSCKKVLQNTDEYLMGGRNLALFPVACSVMASFLSAVSVISVPTEIYLFGASFWVNALSYFISVPITAHVFIPIFHRLKLRSVYEYLEIRFCYSVRVLASLLFTLQMMLYMGVVSYAPAMVFSQVSGISIWISITVMGTLVTVYTTLGGLKAVVWTDVFQIFIVVAGLLMLIIRGTMEVGGVQRLWDQAMEGQRLDHVFDFNPDPFVRHTFWSLVIGGAMTTLSVYAVNQAMVQRYMAVNTLREAQGTIYFNLPGNILTTTLLAGVGLVAYAKYRGCDPLITRRITRPEQILPLYVMEAMGMIPGLGGLFIACVFCAALSTVSSGMNALALVQLEDIVKPIYRGLAGREMSERLSTIISKLTAVFFGVATVGLAFAMSTLNKTMLTITLSSFGMTGGPLLGLFVFAIFVPFANPTGAIFGMLSGLAFSFTIVIGTIYSGLKSPILSLSTALCPAVNASVNASDVTSTTLASILSNYTVLAPTTVTSFLSNVTTTMAPTANWPPSIYHLSYMWYSTFAVLVTLVVGSLVSLATGGWRSREANPKLVINVWKTIRNLTNPKKEECSIPDDNSAKGENFYLPERKAKYEAQPDG